MPQEEHRLWLHTALAAFTTGICFGVSLLGDLAFGITQAYLDQAYRGTAHTLVSPESPLEYAWLSVAVLLIWLARLLLGALVLLLLRQALVPGHFYILNNLTNLAIMGMVTVAMLTATTALWLLLYSLDEERYLFAVNLKVFNYLYSIMAQLGIWAVMLSGYYTGRLPRSVCIVSAGILVVAVIYAQIATTPELPQFLSAAIALLAGLSIAGYMGLVAYSQPEKLATSTFSTSSTGNEIHTIGMATPSDHDTEG
jgi:hypothetical protein